VIRKDRFTEGFRGDAAAESDVDLVWVVRSNLIKSALQRLQRHSVDSAELASRQATCSKLTYKPLDLLPSQLRRRRGLTLLLCVASSAHFSKIHGEMVGGFG